MMSCCQSLDLDQLEQASRRGLTCGPDRCARLALSSATLTAADTALRCAWLREHAEQLRPFDRTGQLSAQLRDFADLIEVAQERGWFS